MKVISDKTKSKTKNSNIGRLLIFLLIALFIVYILAQIYNSVFNRISTEVVGYGSANNSIPVEGIIIRNEELITSDSSGVINYLIRDGERVAIGKKIASFYTNKEDINSINYLNVLNKQIEAYENINSKSALGGVDPISNDAMIGKNIKSVIAYNLKGDFQDAYDLKNSIQMLINRRRYLSGEVENFNAEIAELKSQRDKIALGVGSSISDIYSKTSGYFLKDTDGFEKILTPHDMSKYDVPAIKDLISSKGQTYDNNVIGKIVSDFEFTYSAIIKKQTVDNIRVGQNVYLEFDSLEDVELSAEISRISKETDGYYVVDFKCSYMPDCINLKRKQLAQVIIKKYTGIKVPQSAVRMIDNQMGVYILAGTQVRFKKVEPLYLKDGYYIVKQDFDSSSSLMIYDAVITKGTDLYNGKIIK